ncbi:MAG: hypothetical protein WBM29_04920 [Candidatus Deferrimicrobium sp.]
MGAIGKKILTVAVGLLLATGVPYVAATTVHADPGPGCGCDCPCGKRAECWHGEGCGCGGRQWMHPGMHPGMHGMWMSGEHPMKERMAGHLEEMRGTIAKLRALEAKMDSLKSTDDAAAFRAASLEHSKLLTDLQESHLKHMEGMMGGK